MEQTVEKGTLSERVRKEKEALLSAPPQIDTERLEILLDIYNDTRIQPAIIRRATLFNRLCAEKTLYIDNNPIVGTMTKYKYGSYPLPEEGCAWMERTEELALPRGKVKVTPELRECLTRVINQWRHSNLFSLTRDVVLDAFGVDIRTLSRTGVWVEAIPGGIGHITVPDYPKILNRGLRGIIADIVEQQKKLNAGEPGNLDRFHFYKATRLALEGMIVLAQRYAALARDMAKKEENDDRKQELAEIAAICDRVPANPARNFREAVQSFWFVMLGVWMERPSALNCPPATLTRALYPFYKQDKEAGRIDEEEAIELLQLMFLKMNQLAYVLAPHAFRQNQGRLGQQLSLGGLTPEGTDATNGLDWLVLEAQMRVRLPEPLVNLVYHDKLSEDFLLKCVDLIRTGIGQPAFHNAGVAVARHLFHHKMPPEVARTFAIAGCVQSAIPGYMDGYWETRLNIAKMVELALENGRDPLTGLQIGPQTGDANKFKTYDEFYQAYRKQTEYFVPLTHDVSRTAWSLQRDFACPLASALVNDCIQVGKDLTDGGARYSFGDGVCVVGAVDAGNSLAAIRKLVYEDRKITMSQLRRALSADFEGFEDIKRMCLLAPKYGNDDSYADDLTRDAYALVYQFQSKVDYLGRPVMPSAYSVAAHAAFGEFTGALPNGRHARKPLVDASVSAQGGTDKNGPTALVKSAARAIDCVKYGSSHFNMKFHPTALKGKEGARKLLSLIKTYYDLGGYHVQFNCVSAKTLKAAQLHPEEYKELIVRVAGFSAYFVTLDRDVQEEIIKRTELSF